MSMLVDLPAPFRPRKATVSPGYSVSDTSLTALTEPKCLLTLRKAATSPAPGPFRPAPVCCPVEVLIVSAAPCPSASSC